MKPRDPPKPVRIYKSDNGIWRGEIERDGVRYWWSLNTRDEAEAQRKWALYIEGARAIPLATKVNK